MGSVYSDGQIFIWPIYCPLGFMRAEYLYDPVGLLMAKILADEANAYGQH